MIVLLIVVPAIVALIALVAAARLSRAPRRRAQTSWRLVAAYVLLLVAFGIGTCYAAVFIGGIDRHPGPGVPLTSVVIIAVAAIAYVGSILRLPQPDRHLREAFDVDTGPPPADRASALTLLVVLALGAMALVLVWFR